MYNTILLPPRHLSLASLIFPLLSYLVQWFLASVVRYYKKSYSQVDRAKRLKCISCPQFQTLHFCLRSSSIIFISVNLIIHLLYEYIYFSIICWKMNCHVLKIRILFIFCKKSAIGFAVWKLILPYFSRSLLSQQRNPNVRASRFSSSLARADWYECVRCRWA